MTLFQFPEKAAVNRNIPKTKFYEHASINRPTKEAFVSQIQKIVWAYKLAPETTNLPAANGLYEIQVFNIYLKTRELDDQVLVSIDKAIPHPILFQLYFEGRVKSVFSYKRHNEVDKSKWIVERQYSTDWVDNDHVAKDCLPVAYDLNGLYENMLKKFIPVEYTGAETVQELNSRAIEIEQAKKEIIRLEKRLKNEKQFNRKVDLNNQLNDLREYLSNLLS